MVKLNFFAKRPRYDFTGPLIGQDFNRLERQAALAKIPRAKVDRATTIGRGVPARGLIGTDVSAMDRRSVKAQLGGYGDWRAAWWNLNHAIHKLVRPQASLPEVMAAYHTRHHYLTCYWWTFLAKVEAIARDIHQYGYAEGLRRAKKVAR